MYLYLCIAVDSDRCSFVSIDIYLCLLIFIDIIDIVDAYSYLLISVYMY